ncbi:C40 family peptidase [Eggerthella guodeyinii]|uniref:C40 family peptidase n=1 Tax=Eggerthella guodeyinii TaxID=2690837 RepID=A0A6L7IUJ5_9ACTN|nr:NlpC/P60 family protein [Eggerthella guodeyinii]QOS69316.1 C40 family peptidase [Eggerthella guodeyinii]
MQQQATRARKGVFAGVVAAALAASLMIPSMAYADPTAGEKQAEAQAALASLNSMQSTLDQAAVVYDEALAAQQDAEAKRDEAQARIDEANGQIADLQDRLGSRARSMYRTGGSSFLDLLLGATTFQEFSTGWDMLNTLNENDADLVQQTKDLRAEVQEQEATYAEQQRVATEKADEALRSKQEAASTMSAMQATYDGLSAEAAELLEQERAAQTAAEEAQAQSVVDEAVKQAENAGNAGNNNGGGDTPSPSPSPTPNPTPAPDYNEPIASTVVDRAYSQIGKAYGYDDPSYGAGPTSYDCSGFVSFCLSGSYSRMGSTLTFMSWTPVTNPQPGDVAVNSGHCGIYIGGGQMIHAATYGVGVVQGPVQSGMIFVRP